MWLFPVWLFQGLERMKQIAVLKRRGQAVRRRRHLRPRPGAGGLPVRPPAAFRGHHSRRVDGPRPGPAHSSAFAFGGPPSAVLKREFLDGWHLFVSKMATTLYTTSNMVILGLFTD